MDLGVGAALVAVLFPVLFRERREIQHSAAQAREFVERALGRGGIQVLDHVVANDEVERLFIPIRLV